ncbi:MAG: hydrolase Nlp/P60 [Flavobacteriales bacterium TMED123]|nr:MAG: hydrolase Nlp/P60 [Flavobacteriales bacterium TMED123]|tara:strand:+ start:367 stop:1131 length:765 start_codon:yes stop_codon:yes gene_type:complete
MKYGISNIAIVPMRAEPSDKSEMTNQVLFGEHFKVIEQENKFSKIVLSHDCYEGWICNKQWLEINEENYKSLSKEVSTITIDILDIIKKDSHQPIVIGSILPNYKSGHALINNEMYQFEGLTTPGFAKKEKLIENAFIYLNAPYLWGGRSPLGIDCSGLSQMAYRLQGINLPRDAYQQAEIGTTVVTLEESEAGDLAFFENNEGKIVHVGIILENNYIIHASGKVRIDSIDKQGIFNKELAAYTHKLRLIKSIC